MEEIRGQLRDNAVYDVLDKDKLQAILKELKEDRLLMRSFETLL